jgi:hypothetical protein
MDSDSTSSTSSHGDVNDCTGLIDSSNVNSEPTPSVPETPTQKLVDVKVTDENMALNIMVSFLNVAQKRGVFNMAESAKIWECVTVFSKGVNAQEDKSQSNA